MPSLRTYADVWWRVALVVAAVGGSVSALRAAFASPGACAALLAVVLVVRRLLRAARSARPAQAPAVAPEAWRAGMLMLVGGTAFLSTAIGWDALVGGVGDLVVIGVALAGVPLLYGEGLLRGPAARAARLTAPLPAQPALGDEVLRADGPSSSWPARRPPGARETGRVLLPGLTDEELWHAWHASTGALQRASSPAVRLRIVAVRARYLDALVERDPTGFAAQLRDGGDETADGDREAAGG
jgi:hypothetical protein